MAQDVICGSYQERVPIADDDIGHCVVCLSCGCMLAVVAPVPAVPPPAPRAQAPAPPALSHYPPRYRARFLAGPWPAVLRGLTVTRWATVATFPFIAFWLLAVLAALFVRKPEWLALTRQLTLSLSFGMLFVMFLHMVGQFHATRAPNEYGGTTAAWSIGLVLVGGMSSSVLLLEGALALGLICLMLLLAIAFGAWISFLDRLGCQLCDLALAGRAQKYLSRYVFCTVVSIVLLGVALINLTSADGSLLKAIEFVLGALELVLQVAYYRLLRDAEEAVARRAPVVEPGAVTEDNSRSGQR